MGSRQDKWLSLKENNRSLNALIECWTRTKASNLKEYQTALSLLSNNSNNTVYADADGNIAYWHGNFIPKRSLQYNYSLPVDGSIKNTDWMGVHPFKRNYSGHKSYKWVVAKLQRNPFYYGRES